MLLHISIYGCFVCVIQLSMSQNDPPFFKLLTIDLNQLLLLMPIYFIKVIETGILLAISASTEGKLEHTRIICPKL